MAVKVIECHTSVFEENERAAREVRAENKEKGRCFINLMASPGAGKTTLLLKTAELLRGKMEFAVIEADIAEARDARRLEEEGIRSVQVHTGGECAADAAMARRGLMALENEKVPLVFLENVGNLVCPAEQDVGADQNVMILSVPEGDDKPLKYPLMFTVCSLIVVSKTDTRPYFSFDDTAFLARVKDRNPSAEVIFLSAGTGEGMEQWIRWLEKVSAPTAS